ncbi:hypothetical protein NKG94_27740 [Micromonospora sp. M12]
MDAVAVTVEAHRAALLAAVPALAGAPWFPVDDAESAPPCGGPGRLVVA